MKQKYFHYTLCGLDNVYLLNGYKIEKTNYGSAHSIENIDGLHRAIGKLLATSGRKLSGKEIKFLRKNMGLAQKELAEYLGTTEQSFARWEKNEVEIGGPANRLLKLMYLDFLQANKGVLKQIKVMQEMEEENYNKLYFKHNSNHSWTQQPKAA